ncbi:MAG: 2-hydroxyacyl-CoA dehydratase subunit D [Thermodesulfobacteriota bacterium]
MNPLFHDFRDIYPNRHEIARHLRSQGRRLLGYFTVHVPEEIIHAAGMVPVRMRGHGEAVRYSSSRLTDFVCSYARTCLDLGLQGTYDYLDGIVFAKTCDVMRNLYAIWVNNVKLGYSWFLPLPASDGDAAVECFLQDLEGLRSSLEAHTGRDIDEGSLRRSIGLYNRNRGLLRELYALRKQDPLPVSGSEALALALAGLVIPREDHNGILQDFLEGVQTRGRRVGKGPRLYIHGNSFESLDVIEAMEKAGAEVVMDYLEIGSQYFWADVQEDIEPLRALAMRYLRGIPAPWHTPFDKMKGLILGWLEEYRIQGVVGVVQKYCDTYLYDIPEMEKTLKGVGIPFLMIEQEDSTRAVGQLMTRIEAFLEMLS